MMTSGVKAPDNNVEMSPETRNSLYFLCRKMTLGGDVDEKLLLAMHLHHQGTAMLASDGLMNLERLLLFANTVGKGEAGDAQGQRPIFRAYVDDCAAGTQAYFRRAYRRYSPGRSGKRTHYVNIPLPEQRTPRRFIDRMEQMLIDRAPENGLDRAGIAVSSPAMWRQVLAEHLDFDALGPSTSSCAAAETQDLRPGSVAAVQLNKENGVWNVRACVLVFGRFDDGTGRKGPPRSGRLSGTYTYCRCVDAETPAAEYSCDDGTEAACELRKMCRSRSRFGKGDVVAGCGPAAERDTQVRAGRRRASRHTGDLAKRAHCDTIDNLSAFCGANASVEDPARTACADVVCTADRDADTCCRPNAKCATIANPFTFCAEHGANGLVRAQSAECAGSQCVQDRDAATCCEPDAKCDSITDPSAFCAAHGGGGLVDTATVTKCKGSPCKVVPDAQVCCKRAPRSGPY